MPLNHEPILEFFCFRQAPEIGEHREGSLHPPGKRASHHASLLRNAMTNLSQGAGNHVTRQLFAKDVEELPEKDTVGFRKQAVGLRGELIRKRRLADAPPGFRLGYQVISLQGSEMRSNRIVGKVEFACQFVHGAAPTTQERHDPASGAGKEAFVRTAGWHTGLLLYSRS
jgi:hypothetical protein